MGDKQIYAIKQGDSFRHTLVFMDTSNTAVDVTGYYAYAQVRKKPGDILIAAMNTTTAASEGKFVIEMTPEQTIAIPAGMYEWDVRISNEAGNERETIYEALLEVKQAVTQIGDGV